jgi:transcriptional regulator GlxA family with amidase domain
MLFRTSLTSVALLILGQIAVGQIAVGQVAVGQVAEAKAAKTKKPKKKTVAIVIFDGVELLDFAGPAEVFIVAGQRYPFEVVTVANKKGLVTAMGGIRVAADYSFEDAPKADVIVVPGGNTSSVGEKGVQWIRDSHKSADIVMSVCFGAFLLAKADLLDNVKATTHSWGIESLKSAAPRCQVVEGERFVDSGKIVTTAGVTAGIDGALHVVERIAGKEVAKWTGESWMEHRIPNPKRPQGTKEE